MPIHHNHFELFGLPARFAIDERALEEAYRRVQSQAHPDRFAAAPAAERRVAMQWAAHANEAFRTLRSPLRRAAYLCELNGVPIEAESNTAMPAAFLAQQMQWREELDEARASTDRTRLFALVDAVVAVRTATLKQLEAALDRTRDLPAAAALVRQFMFIEKLGDELGAVAETPAFDAG
ncbi:MAG TPA: Fe-S protein assembly co-chaperone HscB [Burkholderiaceae bacterium]|nr:Fe-S protein assembly co-chaperone HscB [Burkholderiaceae bacterium]